MMPPEIQSKHSCTQNQGKKSVMAQENDRITVIVHGYRDGRIAVEHLSDYSPQAMATFIGILACGINVLATQGIIEAPADAQAPQS
jgi:hypothetical protein